MRGCRAHTQLLDLQGSILGAFELPIQGDAVVWLNDGRRVLCLLYTSPSPRDQRGAAIAA